MGKGEAWGYRASSCIRDIRIPLERCLIHSLSVKNLKTRRLFRASPVYIHPEATLQQVSTLIEISQGNTVASPDSAVFAQRLDPLRRVRCRMRAITTLCWSWP